MKTTVLKSKKRLLFYGLLTGLVTGCLQQEIKPTPDQSTRKCLIRELSSYSAQGSTWGIVTQTFTYNQDGNPIRRQLLDVNRNPTITLTFEYEGLRLKRANEYAGKTQTPENLKRYKTYELDEDFTRLVEHTFARNNLGKYDEILTRLFEFVRNQEGNIKLGKIEDTGPEATPADLRSRRGVYTRFEYDEEQRNVVRVWRKQGGDEFLVNTFGGFDLNGRSPWNANIWLSLTRSYDADFVGSTGFWNENNLALFSSGSGAQSLFYSLYELNAEGFPCLSTAKRSDNVAYIDETLWYYFNCGCRRQ